MTADSIAEHIDSVATRLSDANRAVALTGAGVSTASGLPSYRGADGIWGEEFDPTAFRYGRFQSDPGGFWRDRSEMHERVYGGDIEPNAAHDALAELDRTGVLDAVITQNIDGLHDAAGTESVIELHGNAHRVTCQSCGAEYDAASVFERVRDGEVPPHCPSCGGMLKPDIVLFGEQLPTDPLEAARRHARAADVFLAVGSSLTVEPAASLPRVATQEGATLVVVNFQETPLSGQADYTLRADVTEVLPAVAQALSS